MYVEEKKGIIGTKKENSLLTVKILRNTFWRQLGPLLFPHKNLLTKISLIGTIVLKCGWV